MSALEDGRIGRLRPVAAALLVLPLACGAAELTFPETPMPMHASSPFLRLLGIPPFESGHLVADASATLSLALVSHAERGAAAEEIIELDGESLYFDLLLRKRVTHRLAVGIDVPFVRHSGGFLDNTIEGWHDLFGLSNADRTGPANALSLRYSDAGTTIVSVDNMRSGIGDVGVALAWELTDPRDASGLSLGVIARAELPTGDAERLTGNGGVDVSAGLRVGGLVLSSAKSISLSGTAGLTWPGDGDLLERRRKPLIGYAGVDLAWRVAPRWQAHLAVYGQTAGFDSELPELGSGSLQLAVAGRWQLGSEERAFLDIGIVEDLVSDGTPDFAVRAALRFYR